MIKTYLDTETCGLAGVPVIMQYAYDDGPIVIHEFWKATIQENLDLLDKIATTCVVGFNLAFDWFMLHKWYNMMLLGKERFGPDSIPWEEEYSDWAQIEYDALAGPCFKPKSCLDLMLHARTTKYQVTMERSDIRIRRVPTALAFRLAAVLEDKIHFDPILFARRKKTGPRWAVYDIERQDGSISPDFKDVVLKFKPSIALKALAVEALGEKEDQIIKFYDIDVPKQFLPQECKYAPYALAVKQGGWPEVIEHHIQHWAYHEKAREYASKDVHYTRRLDEHFGFPTPGDTNSILACAVASCRIRGYRLDLAALRKLRTEEEAKLGKYPTAASRVKKLLLEKMGPTEAVIVQTQGTGKTILQKVASWKNVECPFGPCSECDNTGKYTHPAAEIAAGVLDARKASKKIELYDKLLHAGRFHASFKVIGTLSDRMSGADDLNAQGIDHSKETRKCFPLGCDELPLRGGDFDGFEVTIADAAYGCDKLRAALTTKAICPGCKGSGKSKGMTCTDCNGEGKTFQKIHGLFAMSIFPGTTYEDVVKSKGSKELDMYDYGKRGVFALIYGGNEKTLETKLGISIEIAKKAADDFMRRFPGIYKARQKVFDAFCSMRQEGGIGSKVTWRTPAEFVESLFGFRRWFTLENKVCEYLFSLANKPPDELKNVKIKVVRRDREQTASGALQSSLYAAAFGIQAANMRAAANHVIQSSGAQITKKTQARIWDLQPAGSHEWIVQPMNVHDEILCPTKDGYQDQVKNIVDSTVEEFRQTVPLLSIGWQDMGTWADK